jgi:uncharacterized protein (TIGR02453 family)
MSKGGRGPADHGRPDHHGRPDDHEPPRGDHPINPTTAGKHHHTLLLHCCETGWASHRVGRFADMAFKGWPAEALEFYEGLEADNSKVYWTDHKAVYEEAVYAPMAALLTDLADEFGEGRIFRPYRDVRFSADKSPYKTAIAATVGAGYIQFSADGLASGAGMYQMAPDQLERYRRLAAEEKRGSELEQLIDQVRRAKVEVIGVAPLKTAPRGYPKDHPRAELLRNKGLIAWKQWPVGGWLGTAKAKTRVVEFFRASRPLRDWLDAQVGPSTMAEPAPAGRKR